MSLLADLERAAELVDPQFQPSSSKTQGVLAALVYYVEHGDEFLKAAEYGLEGVTKLLQPEPPKEEQPAAVADPAAHAADPVTPAPPPADTPADPADSSLSDEQLAARISDLEAIQASRRATAAQTTVSHESAPPAEPAASPAPGPAAPPSDTATIWPGS